MKSGSFATTRWTVVIAAGRWGSPEAGAALATLCEAYWYPLYAYARRRGHAPEDAEDLTQGFFAELLEKNYVRSADRGRGKFRTFLLTAFARFLSRDYEKKRAQKRGGGRTPLPFEISNAEGRYRREPFHDMTAEKMYERRWALTVVEQALARLGERYVRAGKERLFERLKGYIDGSGSDDVYREAGAALDLSEGGVKVAVHRLKERFRQALRDEIAQTVSAPEHVEEELRHLREALDR